MSNAEAAYFEGNHCAHVASRDEHQRLERKRTEARRLVRDARRICRAQPGYGSPAYRGDPYEAVAMQQQAARLVAVR